jgi:hypothetical protein
MPYISRSDWGAVPPVKTLPVSTRLKGFCLHYMGFPVRTEDPVRLVQSIQRNHMAEPKNWWDVAYNELIAQDGTVLEGRGMLHRCGAQGSTSNNKAYIALGLLLGDGDEPTTEMIQAVRERIAIVRYFQPQATKIVGHSDLKSTTCPGIHVRALIRQGAFEPDATDSPTPPPGPGTLLERIEAVEMEVPAIYAEIEELHRKIQ